MALDSYFMPILSSSPLSCEEVQSENGQTEYHINVQEISIIILHHWERYLNESESTEKHGYLYKFCRAFVSLYSIDSNIAIRSFPVEISFAISLLSRELEQLLGQLDLKAFKRSKETNIVAINRTDFNGNLNEPLELLAQGFGYFLIWTLNIISGYVQSGLLELPAKILLLITQMLPTFDIASPTHDSNITCSIISTKLPPIESLVGRHSSFRPPLINSFPIINSADTNSLLNLWITSMTSSINESLAFSDEIDKFRADSSLSLLFLLLSLCENTVHTESIIGNGVLFQVQVLIPFIVEVHKKVTEQMKLILDSYSQNRIIHHSKMEDTFQFLRLTTLVVVSYFVIISQHFEVVSLQIKSSPQSLLFILKNSFQILTNVTGKHGYLSTTLCLSEILYGTIIIIREYISNIILKSNGKIKYKYKPVLISLFRALEDNFVETLFDYFEKIDNNIFEIPTDNHTDHSEIYNSICDSIKSTCYSLTQTLELIFSLSDYEIAISCGNHITFKLTQLILMDQISAWLKGKLLNSFRNSQIPPQVTHRICFSPFLDNLAKFLNQGDLQLLILDLLESVLVRISRIEEQNIEKEPSNSTKNDISFWNFLETYKFILQTNSSSSNSRILEPSERELLLTHLSKLLQLGGFNLRRSLLFKVLFPLLLEIKIDHLATSNTNANSELILNQSYSPYSEAEKLLRLVSNCLHILTKETSLIDNLFLDDDDNVIYQRYIKILLTWINASKELQIAAINSLKLICIKESRISVENGAAIDTTKHPLRKSVSSACDTESIESESEIDFKIIPLERTTLIFGLLTGLANLPNISDEKRVFNIWQNINENGCLKLESVAEVELEYNDQYVKPSLQEINKNLPKIMWKLELQNSFWKTLTEILTHRGSHLSFFAQWLIFYKADSTMYLYAHILSKLFEKINNDVIDNDINNNNNNNNDDADVLASSPLNHQGLHELSTLLIEMFTSIISIKTICTKLEKNLDAAADDYGNFNNLSLNRLIVSLHRGCLDRTNILNFSTGKNYIFTLISLSTLSHPSHILGKPQFLVQNNGKMKFSKTRKEKSPRKGAIANDIRLSKKFKRGFTPCNSQDVSYSADNEEEEDDLKFTNDTPDFITPHLRFYNESEFSIYYPQAIVTALSLMEKSLKAKTDLTILSQLKPSFELLLHILTICPFNLHIVHLMKLFTKLIDIFSEILVKNEELANSECINFVVHILKKIGKFSIGPNELRKLLLTFRKANYPHRVAEILAHIANFSKEGILPPSHFINFPLLSKNNNQYGSNADQQSLILNSLQNKELNETNPVSFLHKRKHLKSKQQFIRLPSTPQQLDTGLTISLWCSIASNLQFFPLITLELSLDSRKTTHKLIFAACNNSKSIKIIPIAIDPVTGVQQASMYQILVENVIRPDLWQNIVFLIWHKLGDTENDVLKLNTIVYVDSVSVTPSCSELEFRTVSIKQYFQLHTVIIGGECQDLGLSQTTGDTFKFSSLVTYNAILGIKEVQLIYRKGPHVISPFGLLNIQTVKSGELPGFLFSYSAYEHNKLLCSLLSDSYDPTSLLFEPVKSRGLDDSKIEIKPLILPHFPDILHCVGGISVLIYLVSMLVRDGGVAFELPVSLVLETIRSCCQYHPFTDQSFNRINGLKLLARVFETSRAPIGDMIREVFMSWCYDFEGIIRSPAVLEHIILNWRIWHRNQEAWELLLMKLNTLLTVSENYRIFQKVGTLSKLLFALRERSLDDTTENLTPPVANQYLLLIRSLVELQFSDEKSFKENLRLITEFFYVSRMHPDQICESIGAPSDEISKLISGRRSFLVSQTASFLTESPAKPYQLMSTQTCSGDFLDYEFEVIPSIPDEYSLHGSILMQNAVSSKSDPKSVNSIIELEILNLIFSLLVNTPDALAHILFESSSPLKPEMLMHSDYMHTIQHRIKVVETLKALLQRVPEVYKARFIEARHFEVLGYNLGKFSVSKELIRICFKWFDPSITLGTQDEFILDECRKYNQSTVEFNAIILVFSLLESAAYNCSLACHQTLLLLMKLFQDVQDFASFVSKKFLLNHIYTLGISIITNSKFQNLHEEDRKCLLKVIKTFHGIISFYAIMTSSLYSMLENMLIFYHLWEKKNEDKPKMRRGVEYCRTMQYAVLKDSLTAILNVEPIGTPSIPAISKVAEYSQLAQRLKIIISKSLGLVMYLKPVFIERNSTFTLPSKGSEGFILSEQFEEITVLDENIIRVTCNPPCENSNIQNIDWLFASFLLIKLSELILSLRKDIYLKHETAKRYKYYVDNKEQTAQFVQLITFMFHKLQPHPLRNYTIWCILNHQMCRTLVEDLLSEDKSFIPSDTNSLKEQLLIIFVVQISDYVFQVKPRPTLEIRNSLEEFFDRNIFPKHKKLIPKSFARLSDIWSGQNILEYSRLLEQEKQYQKDSAASYEIWIQDLEYIRTQYLESFKSNQKQVYDIREHIDTSAFYLNSEIKKKAYSKLSNYHSYVLNCLHGWRFLTQNVMHERALWRADDERPKVWGLDPTEGPNRIRLRMTQIPCDIGSQYFREKERFLGTNDHHPMIYLFEDLPEHLKQIQLYEKPPESKIKMDVACFSISQDLKSRGTLIITEVEMFFFSDHPLKEMSATKLLPYDKECTGVTWKLADLVYIYQRQSNLQDLALEFCLHNGHTLFLVFDTKNDRNKVHNLILSLRHDKQLNSDSHKLSNRIEEVLAKWKQDGSNFQLLMDLNQLAGRTYNDLMQYPIFPFVLKDYESDELDLNNPETFRDFSFPMPVQDEEGKKKSWSNYLETEKEFMYTSLYSNTPSVLYFLIRIPPFTQLFIDFQDGKFDLADRSFHSILTIWRQNTDPGIKNFKELLPEFFYFQEMFTNGEKLDLGIRQCRTKVDDVELPKWAHNDSRLFVLKMRQALECPLVSKNINKWLDLIFGLKQRGEEAITAFNLFDKRLYTIVDSEDHNVHLKILETTGQVPRQLYTAKSFPVKEQSFTHFPASLIPITRSNSAKKSPSIIFLNSVLEAIVVIRIIDYTCEYFIGTGSREVPGLEMILSQINDRLGPIKQLWLSEVESVLLSVSQYVTVCLKKRRAGCEIPSSAVIARWKFWDNHIEVVDLRSEKNFSTTYIYSHPLEQITVCQFIDKDVLITGSNLGVVTFWAIERVGPEGKETFDKITPHYLHGHTDSITALAICIPFSIMVTGSNDKSIIIWDINRVAFVHNITTPKESGEVTYIAISHTLGDIAVSCENGKNGSMLSVWTINAKFVGQLTCENGISAMEYTSAVEGIYVNVLVTGHLNGMVKMWSSWNLDLVRQFNTKMECPITSISFGAQFKSLIIGSDKGNISIWILLAKGNVSHSAKSNIT